MAKMDYKTITKDMVGLKFEIQKVSQTDFDETDIYIPKLSSKGLKIFGVEHE